MKKAVKIQGLNKLLMLTPILAFVLIYLFFPEKTYAIEPIYKVLQTETTIKSVWDSILTLVNSIAIVALIFIAFANILRININTYGIKKFLPTLVIAIVMANFSYLFCRLLIDLSNAAMSLLMEGTGGDIQSAINSSGAPGVAGAFDFTKDSYKLDLSKVAAAGRLSAIGRHLLFALGEFVGAIMIFILSFLFFIRNYIIYFLVALSPIAFVSVVLPQTKSAFNMWWSNFWKWSFLPVISIFWLWVGGLWYSSGLVPNSDPASTNSLVFSFAFAIVCYYLAVTTPFKMGGGIAQAWGNLGKQAWGKTGGAAWKATGGAAGKAIKEGAKGYYDRQKGWLRERAYGTGIGKSIRQRQADFKIRNDLPNLVRDKMTGDAYRKAALAQLGAKTPQEWKDATEQEKAIFGRLKGITRGGVTEELKSTNYRTGRTADLTSHVGINREGKLADAYDFMHYQTRMHPDTNQTQAGRELLKLIGENPLKAFEESGAAAVELARRSGRQLNQPENLAALEFFGAEPHQLTQQLRQTYPNGIPATNMGGRNLSRSFDPGFMGVSAVGEEVTEARDQAQATLENLVGPEAGARLADAALHGSGDFTVYANNLHLNASPQARAQAEQAFNELRGVHSRLAAEEMRGQERRIDWEMNGAKIVHDQVQKGGPTSVANQSAQLGTMGLSASEGLTALQRNDMASAINEAKKFGYTDLGADNPETRKQLNSLFRSIETGVRDVQSQRSASGTIPDWSKIETSLRAAKSAQAEQTADTTASARIITEQQAPAIMRNLEDTTVAGALSDQSEHLAELTQHVNRVADETAKARGMQPIALNTQQSKDTLLGAITSSGVSTDAPMSDAMSSPDVRRKFAEMIAESTVKAQRRVPQVDAVKPRTQQPLNAPDVTNVTQNVTNVTQAGAGTKPTIPSQVPPIPPKENPPATPSPESPQTPPPFNASKP